MSITRPAVKLTVDGRELSGPEAATLIVLVELHTAALLDRVRLSVGPLSPLLDSAPGARLEVSAGDGDDLAPVFSGVLSAVWHSPWGTTLEALTKAAVLTRTRVGRSYVRQQASDIVADLLSAGSVDPGEVDAGIEMAAFHVDERRTVWQHLQTLATLTGRQTASAADGSVNFTPPKTGSADHGVRAAAELIQWSVGGREQGAAGPPTAAVSAAGEQGADAWHLLHHEPDGGAAALLHPAIRDRNAAQAWGDGLTRAATRLAAGGSIVIVGDPTVRAGDLVDVQDLPRGASTYRVLAADHLLDAGGLRTRLRLEAVA